MNGPAHGPPPSAPRIASRRPAASEFDHPDYGAAIQRVAGTCAVAALESQLFWLCELASSLSTEQVDRVHRPYRWTVRQVFEHGANVERLLGYRIMALADGSEPQLPDWDHEGSAASRFGLGNFSQLVAEWGELRKANVHLLRRLTPPAWERSGTVAGHRVNVRTLAWLVAAHLQHHLEIVENRCGVTANRSPGMVK